MAERKCAFTGFKAEAKLRFPEDDPHSWVEVPCSLHYKIIRSLSTSISKKLLKDEGQLVQYFWLSELLKSGVKTDLRVDIQELKNEALKRENRMLVEHAYAKYEKDRQELIESEFPLMLEKRIPNEK